MGTLTEQPQLPGDLALEAPALERRGLWWLLWSFLLCPCHLPVSLGVLTALLAGTSIGAVLPFTPLAGTLGFATLPVAFFLILLGMIGAYLVLVEFAKARFYAVQGHPHRARPAPRERHERRVRRRAARFTHHLPVAPLGRR